VGRRGGGGGGWRRSKRSAPIVGNFLKFCTPRTHSGARGRQPLLRPSFRAISHARGNVDLSCSTPYPFLDAKSDGFVALAVWPDPSGLQCPSASLTEPGPEPAPWVWIKAGSIRHPRHRGHTAKVSFLVVRAKAATSRRSAARSDRTVEACKRGGRGGRGG